jgi:hypothetical protein
MPSPTNRNIYRRLATLVFTLLWVALLAWVVVNRQAIEDWWRLRNYSAPAAVADLAKVDAMTDYARKVFYVNEPSIQNAEQFAQNCPKNGGEQTIVLGCYKGNQNGIYILNVDDPRLDGVKRVTAAHEMLHAVYDRLSTSERQKVDSMLQAYYQNGLSDDRIKSTIEAYKISEPHDVVNEMHSIFGTEIGSLPPELETYYAKYFTNRAQVADYAAKYQAEFTSRRQQVEQYDTQLGSMKGQIDGMEADLQAKRRQIQAQDANLNGLRSSGQINAYNAGVPAYNALIDSYNAEVAQIRSLITQYNSLVAARNAVALEEGQLVKELSGQDVNTINN